MTAAANSTLPTHRSAWNAVQSRDRSADGTFVYAVRTTGVYCRPSCPSRLPRPENVAFFASPGDAEREGFRSCLRCRPTETVEPSAESISRRVRMYIDTHIDERITLALLARETKVSPFHLQRVFTQVVGVSPREYAESKRLAHFKREVRKGSTVSRAVYDAGFGSASRLYAKSNGKLGMTPSAYRAGGEGKTLHFTTGRWSGGRFLLAATERGIAALTLGVSDEALLRELREEFPNATIERSDATLASLRVAAERQLTGLAAERTPPLDLQGTPFQLQVWKALLAIPRGSTASYSEVARRIGRPAAVRAVAGACASNKVAVLVPCHRVVREDGGVGGYRWGVARKERLLKQEAAG